MMRILRKISQVRAYRNQLERRGFSIGFVPTMGYLHQGHLSLIRKAKQQTDSVWVSIYVNPTQFAPQEDLDKYPRDEKRDSLLCDEEGIDVLFMPTDEELYPRSYRTYVTVENLSEVLCGASRPTHFRGVTTIVTKLFNIVRPHRAYFGQKDAQQAIILDRMAWDLNFDIQIVVCPIVREPDGLAMSSRNVYLTQRQREQAVVLAKSLKCAEKMFKNGEKNSQRIVQEVRGMIQAQSEACIDYVEVVRPRDLCHPEMLKGGELVVLAVFFGSTRLIDNTILGNDGLLPFR